MNKKKMQKALIEIKDDITNFLQENKVSVFEVKEDYLTSKELGETQKISAVKTNKILEEKGYIEKDENKNWQLSRKGKLYGFTPIKFVTTIKGNTLITHLKKENPKWFKSFKEPFAEIIKEECEENKNGRK